MTTAQGTTSGFLQSRTSTRGEVEERDEIVEQAGQEGHQAANTIIVLPSPSCSVMDCTDYVCPCLPVSWTIYVPVSHSDSLSLCAIVYLSHHLGAYRCCFCSPFTVSPHLYRILLLSSITPRLPFGVGHLSVRALLMLHTTCLYFR